MQRQNWLLLLPGEMHVLHNIRYLQHDMGSQQLGLEKRHEVFNCTL